MIHRYDPARAADAAFEHGELAHLVPGNHGRMLDPRRTPFRIAGLRPEIGCFECEVLDFEDRGARWILPFERIGSFQFARGGRRGDAAAVREVEAAIERFDRPLEIPIDASVRTRTLERLASLKHEAASWLETHSELVRPGVRIDLSSREGDPRAWTDLNGWMDSRGLTVLEKRLAAQYVSNPCSGECVKGHRIVLAELGLAFFAGTVVRDPDLFQGAWSKAARADHLLARLAFVQVLFARCAPEAPLIHRGIATDRAPETRTGLGFVSATFVLEVAESMLGPPGTPRPGVIQSRPLPLDRLFMSYVETEPMNRQFREAEAVLLEGADGEF